MENWSVEQVCNWLKQRNLGELVPKFRGKHFCCLVGAGVGDCLVFLAMHLIDTAYLVLVWGMCVYSNFRLL